MRKATGLDAKSMVADFEVSIGGRFSDVHRGPRWGLTLLASVTAYSGNQAE
jgi:hypothetical protein